MKKIILASFLGLALTSGVAFGAAKVAYSLVLALPDGAVQILSNKMLDKDVMKFVDGGITCYMVTTKNSVNIVANTSISCVK